MKCPKCGQETQPAKTWHLTSPLPDSEGRISITIMGSFKCSNCGYSWRGRISVLKVGGEHDVEVGESERRSRRKRVGGGTSSREGKVIEVDVSNIVSEMEE
ncbi:MAG: chromatin protein Cren7 [Sulfolobales archaeon]|nr:chromatin protein Cren7 [Sulfolobales archaeon]MDW8010117.1 chromatin protein Cren7 [Sulfolobales archaeon]